jgi:hypothetical protein
VFWAGALVGATIVGWAGWELWQASGDRARSSTARFVVGAVVVHDLVWAPAVAAVLAATTVLLPGWARRPVRLGLAFSALLVLISWPEVRAYGRRARNPTLLPLDYGRNLLLLLAVVWLLVGAALAWSARAARHR